MSIFGQQLVDGLFLGGLYALFALGLTLSLGVARVVNLAHGVTLSLVAIVAIKLSTSVHIPFPLLVLVGAGAGAVVGIGLELVAFRPLRAGPSERNVEMPSLVSSLALLLIIQTALEKWTNAQTLDFPVRVFNNTDVSLGPFKTQWILIVTVLLGSILVLAVWWMLRKTQMGRAMRAVAIDDEAAASLGINANVVKLFTISLSSALAGVAGVLLAVALGAVDFTSGQDQLLRGFSVVILGGIGSVPGALLGGLLLGVLEGATIHFAGSQWQPAVSFVVLIVVLLARPAGLFGRKVVDRA